jgi:hypothetical protein
MPVLDSNFTDEQFKALKDKIELIDNKAISEDGFWKEELEMLIANRNDFLSRKIIFHFVTIIIVLQALHASQTKH